MTTIKTPIIPTKSTFFGAQKTLDYQAICVFSALGFFLDDDTYYKEQKVLKPGHIYNFSDNDMLVKKEPYFKWHYSPQERPLNQVIEEFSELFETIVKQQVGDKKVILPLSGGLDSRTQAVALSRISADVHSYSYKFQGGLNESAYGEKIAKACGFPFQDFTVRSGYLWDCIDQLARINGCYSEFTHPRQMAFVNQYNQMGNVFSLGHWGDVLFDDMGVKDDLPFEQQVDLLLKKVVKKGGLELANILWKHWDLLGDFEDYLYERIKTLHANIDISNSANARIRAFKSLYWAPRWTSVNLSVFESESKVTLPYYDNRMCEFISRVPERFLAKRQIQIGYIKERFPEVARIPWQAQRPFNLYTYHRNHKPWNLPYRIYNKFSNMLNSQSNIQRNWELQFLGEENEHSLKQYLFSQTSMEHILSKSEMSDFYRKFKEENAVTYSHPVSMLLTLSLFFKQQKV
ncbi:asparagine synthase-related protein [Winogradskyella undariae]|uniref:asparagine synthase-related protein n=1 Tax=Winogradskyella undariae TaxID=1285465 RepID=UPI0015CED663|nr:asparagine synthase C-terminal domain-containing protein [Winogradskyella undariae]